MQIIVLQDNIYVSKKQKNSRNRKKPFREHQNQYVIAYQMTTLSSSGRNMAPSVMPKAS